MTKPTDDGLIAKTSSTLLSVHNLSLAVGSAVAGFLLLSVICAGTVNIGGGKLVGGVGKNFVTILSEAAHEMFGIPEDQPISIFGWAPETTVKQVFNTTPKPDGQPTPVPGGSTNSGGGGAISTPVPAGPPAVDPAIEAERIRMLNEELLRASSYWALTGDWDTTLGYLQAAAVQFRPGEQWPMYDAVFGEAMSVKTAAGRVMTEAQALIDGGSDPADPQVRYELAQTLSKDVRIVLVFLNGNNLADHQSRPMMEIAAQASSRVIKFVDAYAKASGAAEKDFYPTIAESWAGTTWQVLEYDWEIGGCHCTHLKNVNEDSLSVLKGVEVTIPQSVYDDLFPEQQGFLTTEVGQIVTFPAPAP